jgi:hypothetical protein
MITPPLRSFKVTTHASVNFQEQIEDGPFAFSPFHFGSAVLNLHPCRHPVGVQMKALQPDVPIMSAAPHKHDD